MNSPNSERVWFWIALLFVGGALAVRAAGLFSTPYARGFDGYFYAAQVRDYLLHGAFFTRVSSWVLPMFALLGRLPWEPPVTNKIGIVLLHLPLAVGSYRLGNALARGPGGAVLTALLLSSGLSFYFTLEFARNLGGIVGFVFVLLYSLRVMQTRGRPGALTGLAVALVATVFAHKLMAGLGLCTAAAACLYASSQRVAGVNRRPLLAVSALLGLALLGGVVAALVVWLRPQALGSLALVDLSRFGSVSFSGRLPQSSFLAVVSGRRFMLLEFVLWGLALAGVPWLLLSRRLSSGERAFAILNATLLVLLLLPFFSFRNAGMGFRLFLVHYIPAGVLVIMQLGLLMRRPGVGRNGLAVLVVALCATYQVPAAGQLWYQDRIDYRTAEQVIRQFDLPQDAMIIVHQGLDYFYYYSKGEDAMHHLPDARHKEREIYRLAYGVPPWWWKKHGAGIPHRRLMGFYTLLAESDWQRFLRRLPPSRRARLRTWRNPHRQRPVFVRRVRGY